MSETNDMSEIRQELEYFANLAEKQENETSSVEEDKTDKAKTVEPVDEYLTAPKGYSEELAKTFASLPKEWRSYLHAREAEIDKGFNDLRSRREIDNMIDGAYSKRTGELKDYGITSQKEWLENLFRMDELLSQKPDDAIRALSEIYHVEKPRAISPAAPSLQTINSVMQEHIIKKQIDDFINAVNDNGEKAHPFYYQVVPEMCDLLNSGLAKNVNEAYDKAIWFNRETRDKLLAERTQNSLEIKSKDAKKAKEVSFAPKSKTVPDAKDLTLREELEMRFAALMDDE